MSVFVLTTLTYPELKNVCRVCLKKEELYDLYILQCGELSIKEIIENLTGDILIRNDETPDKICTQCTTFLSTINTFLNTYKATKSLYEEVIRKHWSSADVNVNYAIEVNNTAEMEDDQSEDNEDPLKIEFVDVKNEPIDTDDVFNVNEPQIDIQVLESEPNILKIKAEKADTECQVINIDSQSQVERQELKRLQPYTCLKCNLSLIDFQAMLNHFHENHRKRKHLCMLCNKMLNTSPLRHMMEHRPFWLSFYCKHCLQLFETVEELHVHEKVENHYKIDFYICPCCKRRFRKLAFQRHFLYPDDSSCTSIK